MKLYRAVPNSILNEEIIYQRQNTKRIPSNIPYLIDNIWEYLRPEIMPSRRFSAYASPTKELALENASAYTETGYIVKEVLFLNDNYKIAHIPISDAKYHSDINKIKKIVLDHLGKEFSDLSVIEKSKHCALFLPTIDKIELEHYFSETNENKELLLKIKEVSVFWSEAKITPQNHNGELFFELQENCSYKLNPLS